MPHIGEPRTELVAEGTQRVIQATGHRSPGATQHRRTLPAGGPAVDNERMSADDDVCGSAVPINTSARPHWLVTGYKFFPYAARQGEQWWVLRMNYDFPEHDLYTIFVDGTATKDVSGSPHSPVPLAAGVGVLSPCAPAPDRPVMAAAEAEAVVRPCTPFLVYGSEVNDPCDWCDWLADRNPFEPRSAIDTSPDRQLPAMRFPHLH